MGNHTAGDLIANYAAFFSEHRKPNEAALDVLDRAVAKAKVTSGFSPDAEFEASHPTEAGTVHPIIGNWTDPHPLAPLGMLMVEAFAPNGLRDLPRYWWTTGFTDDYPDAERLHEEAYFHWSEEVYEPFRKRYGLC
jgi:hypothetical protein